MVSDMVGMRMMMLLWSAPLNEHTIRHAGSSVTEFQFEKKKKKGEAKASDRLHVLACS